MIFYFGKIKQERGEEVQKLPHLFHFVKVLYTTGFTWKWHKYDKI